jgi:hypothetical protein
VYDGYNKRWAGLHGAISQAPFQAAAEQLKTSTLYPHIGGQEVADATFATWLRSLNETNFKFSSWATAPKARTCAPHLPGPSVLTRDGVRVGMANRWVLSCCIAT